jgi:hypothetical protein
MKKQLILYLYKYDSNCQLKATLVEELKKVYDVVLYESADEYSEYIELPSIRENKYDLVIIQNSLCLTTYKTLLNSLKKIPWIFVSCGCDINNYVAPSDSLYEIFNFGTPNLESWAIPRELQTILKIPVSKKNYYKEKSDEENCRMVYYPTNYTIQNADRIIVSLSDHYKNIDLSIVSDSHSILESVLPSNVKIIPRKASIAYLKKAHVVLASGPDAIQALACAKPCVIVGDHGFGGMVSSENYELLKMFDFRGRPGASFNEMIPVELLNYEIQKSLSPDNKDNCVLVQKKIISDYNYLAFRKKLMSRINYVMSLARKIRQKESMKSLKPQLTSIYGTEEIGTCIYVKRGSIYYGEIDEEFLSILKLCTGKLTVGEILSFCKSDKGDIRIICDNLIELWRKKLIVFYE